MIFTIDNDNDIRAHATEAQAQEASKPGTIVVHSEEELNKAAAEWPASRLVELWNSFAGVAPFLEFVVIRGVIGNHGDRRAHGE